MSRATLPDLLLEWSPTAVASYEPAGKQSASAPQIEQLALAGGRALLLALSRRSTFVKSIRVPDAPKDDIMQLLRVSAGTHLPLPANEVAFDIHITQDRNLEGRMISLLATRSSDLKEILAKVKAQGCRVARVIPVAWGSVLIAEKLGLEDAVVVHRTDEGWGIDLVHKGGLRYSRLAPLSSTDLDDEIARTCAAAEISCPAIVAPNGAPLSTINHATPMTCIQALGEHPERLDINLELQEEVLARTVRDKAQKNRTAIALSVAALAMVAGIYFDRKAKQDDYQRTMSQWQARHRPEMKTKEDFVARINLVASANKALDQALTPGQRLSDALLAAANVAPEGVWLTGVNGERGKPLQLRGNAMQSNQVSQFVKALADKTDGRFRDVQLVFANQSQINQQQVVQFSINLVAVGNVPVVEPQAQGAAKK